MEITDTLIGKVTGIRVMDAVTCDGLGLTSDLRRHLRLLSFLDDPAYADALREHPAIVAAFVTTSLAGLVESAGKVPIVSEDPRHDFFTLLNYVGRAQYSQAPSHIDATAIISPDASVAEFNVRIGAGCVVEAGAVILPDVVLGPECIIRAGAALGTEGFEHKRTSRGLLSIFHDGEVRIERGAEIGSGTCIDKGFSFRHTIIGEETRIDNLVHIAHAVHAGKRCLIVAHAMIGGSVTLGDDVWVGPCAAISNGLTVGDGAFISLGAVVTRNVGPRVRVTGNFAIPHDRFLRRLKRDASDE